jgi:hypothetical protein
MVLTDISKLLLGNKFDAGVALLVSLLSIVLLLFLGEYLWNKVLVKLVTVVKPITSIWQLLGLYVLIALLCGRC